jgi:geranylgeranyl diphosphate synthase type I
MPEDLLTYLKLLTATIEGYLDTQDSFRGVSRWGDDTLSRFRAFIPKGKLLRSNLAMKTAENLDMEDIRDFLPVAASMEFLHSGLLIHDDIIDQDHLRRGDYSIPEQYKRLYPEAPEHLGHSLAICAGDIGFFFAFDLLSSSSLPAESKINILSLISKEMALVGQAEMEDTYLGYTDKDIDVEEVVQVYRYKTARYTFSLPMIIGAMGAQASAELISKLDKIGEYMGILFQVKDDEIGLMGDQQTTGKPVGSDIEEDKKTIFSHYLFASADDHDLEQLNEIFGKKDLSEVEVHYVQECIKKYQVLEQVQPFLEDQAEKAREFIKEIPSPEMQKLLNWFVDYNLRRES